MQGGGVLTAGGPLGGTDVQHDSVSALRPYSDPSITFDFESALEKISANKPVVRPVDPKFRTVVCIHWYEGLCMKGEACDFLHELDPEKVPECREGERCQDRLCPFKHLKAEERPICNNFNLGFCPHGLACRFQHRKRPQEELVPICDYANVISAPRDREYHQQSNLLPDGQLAPNPALTMQQNLKRKLNYRTAMCHSWVTQGTCAYGDHCDYAHSEEERQKQLAIRERALPLVQQAGLAVFSQAPGQNPMQRPGVAQLSQNPLGASGTKRALATALDAIVLKLREWDGLNIEERYKTPLSLPPPLNERLPDANLSSPRYFVVRAKDYEYLARSVMKQTWIMLPALATPLNIAFDTCSAVFLFFAVDGEEGGFGGVARMTTPFLLLPNADPSKCEIPPHEVPEITEAKVEWLRLCELDYHKTAYLTSVDPLVLRELPVALALEGQELPPSFGHALMIMLYREPGVVLEEDPDLAAQPLYIHPPGPSPEVDIAFRESPPAPYVPPADMPSNVAMGAPIVKSEGLIISLPSPAFFTEAMNRQMFGLPRSEATLEVVRPGTIVLLYTPYDGRMHGVFESISPLERDWDPTAFLDQAGKSALPIQFKFRTLLPCGPMHENALVSVFRQREGVYSPEELQPIVNVFTLKTKQGDQLPPLKSPAIDAVDRGLPPPLIIPRGITMNEPFQIPGTTAWKQTCLVNIDYDPRFKAPNRLIGKNGINMQMVREKSGCTRAKVYAGPEAPADGIMEIAIDGPSKESVEEAMRLCRELLDELQGQWEEYKERGQIMRLQRQGLLPADADPSALQAAQVLQNGQPPGGPGGMPPSMGFPPPQPGFVPSQGMPPRGPPEGMQPAGQPSLIPPSGATGAMPPQPGPPRGGVPPPRGDFIPEQQHIEVPGARARDQMAAKDGFDRDMPHGQQQASTRGDEGYDDSRERGARDRNPRDSRRRDDAGRRDDGGRKDGNAGGRRRDEDRNRRDDDRRRDRSRDRGRGRRDRSSSRADGKRRGGGDGRRY